MNMNVVVIITHYSLNISFNIVFDYFKDDQYLVMLSTEQVTGDIMFFHHIQEISGWVGSNFKSKLYLKGWGLSATALQLEDRLFSESMNIYIA